MCIRSCFSSFEKILVPRPSSCTPIRKRTPLRSLGFFPMMDSSSPNRELHFLSRSRSRLNILKFLPEFESPAQMWNHNRTADQRCDAHGFINFSRCKSEFFTFSQVITHAIVAPENQGTR